MTRPFTASYTLCDGTRGRLLMIAASSWDAVDIAFDLFGERLRRVSAKPGGGE